MKSDTAFKWFQGVAMSAVLSLAIYLSKAVVDQGRDIAVITERVTSVVTKAELNSVEQVTNIKIAQLELRLADFFLRLQELERRQRVGP